MSSYGSCSYNSYYYDLDNGESYHLSRVNDHYNNSVASGSGLTNRGTLSHCPSTSQLDEREPSDVSYAQIASENDFTYDTDSDEDPTRSPLPNGLMRPRSPQWAEYNVWPRSPRLSTRDVSGSYASQYRSTSPSERFYTPYSLHPRSPLWQGADDIPPHSPPSPVLPVSDVQPTVSPEAVMPRYGSPQEEYEDSVPSPLPSSSSEESEPPSPSPAPQSPPSYNEAEAPIPPSPASSPRVQPSQERHTNAPNPVDKPAASSKRRRATGRVKETQTRGIIPQVLLTKLNASSVHQGKEIAWVVARKRDLYWTVKFTDGKSCCVCNVPGPYCERICADSRGMNRHFRAAPHFMGKDLSCNHPTHPCTRTFKRQDVLTRHLTMVAHPRVVTRRSRGAKASGSGTRRSGSSGKETTVKKSRVAREEVGPY